MERAAIARQISVDDTAGPSPKERANREIFPTSTVVFILGIVIWGGIAQAQTATEYQVKAAFLFNFAKFVEWPPGSFSDASTPIRICVLGQDPFGEDLRNIIRDKVVNGRKLQVDELADLHLAKSCHILFIASSEKGQLKRVFEGLRGMNLLTVGDTQGFAGEGGIINFVRENDRVQFEVNRKAAEQAGLKVSSKLLNVAKLVIE